MQQHNSSGSTALVTLIEQFLDSKKAEDIKIIDLREKTSLGDFMVIASGQSQRQISAMAQGLHDELKKTVKFPITVEGFPACDWVLLDVGTVIVHLFRPEVRAFYRLEDMWTMQPDVLVQTRPQDRHLSANDTENT